MKIGVDACCWANGRGYGRFTRELLRTMVALAPEDDFYCFLDPWAAERFDLTAPNVHRVLVSQSASPTQAAAADGARSPLDMLRLTRAVWKESPDVFFSPSVYTYFPLPPALPAVVAIHDAIAERFPQLTLPSARARLFWNAKVKLAVWQSRLVLTVSEYSAGELNQVLGVKADRIRVATEAPAGAYRPSSSPAEIAGAAARVGLPAGARWLTYVGGFNPHKHVDVIVRAHARLAQEMGGANPPHLLLVGTTTSDVFHNSLEGIRRTIAGAGTGDLVHWTGFVADDELRHLHSGSLGLILISASEGFGLPAVEAAACGSPVIATTESPLPKLLDGGGIFIPPGDEDALLAALRQLLADEHARRAMGLRGRERVGQLSWTRSARIALATLREAAGEGDTLDPAMLPIEPQPAGAMA